MMKRKTCSLVRIEQVRGDVVIFFPTHNITLWHRLCGLDCFSINRWQLTKWKCNSSDTSFWQINFCLLILGYPQFFHPHNHSIRPSQNHQKYKIPSRSLFIYFAAKTVSLIFSSLFFFPFFFLNKRCLWF